MKRAFAFAMVCLLLLPFSVQASMTNAAGLDPPLVTEDETQPDSEITTSDMTVEEAPASDESAAPPSGQTDPPREITRIYSRDEKKLFIIAKGGDAATLADKLDTKVTAEIKTEIQDGWQGVALDIVWKYSSLDTSFVGWSYICGKAILPEGVIFPDGDLTMRTRILVYDTEQSDVVTLVGAQAPLYDPVTILKQGSARSELEELFQRVGPKLGYYNIGDEEGTMYSFNAPITYDLSLVDLDTVGGYKIFSRLPSYFKYGPVAEQMMTLYVRSPDQVDLSAWHMLGDGSISMDWFPLLQTPELWVSIDDGKWASADCIMERGYSNFDDFAPFYFLPDSWDEDVVPNYIGLRLFEDGFVAGHTYEFEVRYGDDGYSVNSFLLDLREGHTARYGNSGGSRGGDDREDTELPPVEPDDGNETPTPPAQGGDNWNPPPTVDPDGGSGSPAPPTPPDHGNDKPAPPTDPGDGASDSTPPLSPDSEWDEITPPAEVTLDALVVVDPPLATPIPIIEESNLTAGQTAPLAHKPPPAQQGESVPAPPTAPQDKPVSTPPQQRPNEQSPAPVVAAQPDDIPEIEDVPEIEEATVPLGDTSTAEVSPQSGAASIVIVGMLGAVGAVGIWKLFGKRLVKRR